MKKILTFTYEALSFASICAVAQIYIFNTEPTVPFLLSWLFSGILFSSFLTISVKNNK